MNTLQKICLGLVIIGALNWGMVGLFQFDLIASIFGGSDEILPRIIYTLVAIAGVVNIGLLFQDLD